MIKFTMAKRAVSIARNNGAIDAIADEISRPSNRNSGHSGMRRTVIASISTRRVDTRVARGILAMRFDARQSARNGRGYGGRSRSLAISA